MIDINVDANDKAGSPEKPIEDSSDEPKKEQQYTSQQDQESTVPPAEPPSSDGESKASSVDAQQKIKIDEVRSAHTQFINKQIAIQTALFGDAMPASRDFTPSMTVKMSAAIENDVSKCCVYDEILLNRCLKELTLRRMLLIYGESEIGKRTFSRLLALHLYKQDEERLHKILIVAPLASQVRIDLLNSVACHSDLAGYVLLMDDVFSKNNQSLNDFFISFSEDMAFALTNRLRDNKSYIILTSDLETLPHHIRSSSLFGFQVQMPRLNKELLMLGLKRRLEALCHTQPDITEAITKKLTLEVRNQIIERAKSMPRIRRFFDRYISELINGKLTVDQAFDLIDDLSMWFLRDLSKTPESWIFAFTLAHLRHLGLFLMVSHEAKSHKINAFH
jgi:hypothetical protein